MKQKGKHILSGAQCFILLIFLLGSCSIPEVKEQKRGSVTIASDFLEKKDTVLFKNFQKQQGVKIRIVFMSVDSIQKHFKTFKYNSKIDLVFLKSSRSMLSLSENRVFNQLNAETTEGFLPFCSPKNDFIALGINPYIFNFGDSIPKRSSIYHDLIRNTNWKLSLDKKEMTPFYASVINQFGDEKKKDAKSWLKKLLANSKISQKDSKNLHLFSLDLFSISDSLNQRISFPNENSDGSYFDTYCLGIIRNSQNFYFAEKLINYFLNENNNEVLTGKLGLFPLQDPKGRSDYSFQNDYPNLNKGNVRMIAPKFHEAEKLIKELQLEIDTTKIVIKNKPPRRVQQSEPIVPPSP